MNRIPPIDGKQHSQEHREWSVSHKWTHISSSKTLKSHIADAVGRLTGQSLVGVVIGPPKRRTQTLTAPENVVRETEVLWVGDLHGNIEILYKNLKSLKVMDTFGRWIGGNRRLVFLGDIIGDRGTTGLECMRQIDRLRKEARMAGGDISVLAGNHEDIAIWFLTQRRIASPIKEDDKYALEEQDDAALGHAFTNALNREQWLGIIEFPRDYLGFDVKPTAAGMKQIRHCGSVALHMMRSSPEGVTMLENICQMKLIEHIDDTLFVHTALTSNMARMIILHGVDALNEIYQQSLRNLLLSKKPIPPHSDYYKTIDTFLFVDNRENNLTEQEARELREMWFNRVFHGHEDNAGKITTIAGLEICSIDHSAGKRGGHMHKRSIGRIFVSGKVVNG